MHLDPSRQEEMFNMLDNEWEHWKEGPPTKRLSESDELEVFLDVVKAFGSSTDRAYIDAWFEARFTRERK